MLQYVRFLHTMLRAGMSHNCRYAVKICWIHRPVVDLRSTGPTARRGRRDDAHAEPRRTGYVYVVPTLKH